VIATDANGWGVEILSAGVAVAGMLPESALVAHFGVDIM